MIELEEGFSENDRYLINEYLKNGTDDFLLTGVGEKTFVVPYKYRKATKDEVSAIERFRSVLLDFQRVEADKYSDRGLVARTENFEGIDYVVPFEAREQNVSARQVMEYVAEQATLKYDSTIEIYRELEKCGVNLGVIDFSTAALVKYQHRLEQVCRKELQNVEYIRAFCRKANGKVSKIFKFSAGQIAKQVSETACQLGNFASKHRRAVGVSSIIGLGTIGAHYMPQSCTYFEDKAPVATVNVQRSGTYVDFRGVEHSDTFGNIARIMDMKAEISAMLIAVEGYADEAYKDGKGVLTIGSGTTFYLDENGRHRKVKAGERITPKEAMLHKWRFIEAEMLDLLGDKMGRACSDKELMTCIGAGFCWGANALKKSQFYKSVCCGEDVAVQSRKLTGFRKQKGLLKREYLLSACLLGKWDGKDLLELPIYKYKGQYLGCGIYRLRLNDIMHCKTDKKGNLLKDKQGHHIPVINADDFGTFFDNYDEIKRKLGHDAQYTLASVKKVRDFMPAEMIESINLRVNSEDFTFMLQKNAGMNR